MTQDPSSERGCARLRGVHRRSPSWAIRGLFLTAVLRRGQSKGASSGPVALVRLPMSHGRAPGATDPNHNSTVGGAAHLRPTFNNLQQVFNNATHIYTCMCTLHSAVEVGRNLGKILYSFVPAIGSGGVSASEAVQEVTIAVTPRS